MKLSLLTIAIVLCSLTLISSDEVLAQTKLGGPGKIIVSDSRPFLGIKFLESKDGSPGAMIDAVIQNSPADKAGLKVKDIVLKIDELEIDKTTKIPVAMSEKKIGDEISLTIRRADEELVLKATLAARSKFKLDALVDSKAGLQVKTPSLWNAKSEDGLQITIDVYAPYPLDTAPCLILCHQAGWSRGEYREIAPKLNLLGFNCFAMDQRSGGSVNDVINITNKLAVEQDKATAFLDAEQDIIATIKKIRGRVSSGVKEPKVILWGSSYSAALALRIAGEHPELVEGVAAFAPGEYFERFGKPADWIETSAKKIADPVFITSAKKEVPNWKSIFDSVPGDAKVMFEPESAGNHGSRALWEKFDDHQAYWGSIEGFLKQFLEEDEARATRASQESRSDR